MRRLLVDGTQAVPSRVQHTQPCGDCPWRVDSLPGWLGSLMPEQWLKDAHGEVRIDCHTLVGPQCAGAAIYRANVLKRPRDPELLRLPRDPERVLASPAEFLRHHAKTLDEAGTRSPRSRKR